MSSDQFALALHDLGAPLFLDDAGTSVPLGVQYAATTAEGARVRVTRLSPLLATRLRDRDAFVRVLEQHRYEGAGIAGDTLYIVERPPAGESLAARLAREGTVSPTALSPLAWSVASAVATYHRELGAHGCLTPASIHVGDEGRVGLRFGGVVPALLAAGCDLPTISEQLQLAGYLAPELAQSPVVSVHADIFALGATFYTAATGRPPFGGRTTAGVMAAVLTEDGGTKTSAASRLTAALLRAIEHDPADRWHDAQQFADAIGERIGTAASPPRSGCLPMILVISALVLWNLTQ